MNTLLEKELAALSVVEKAEVIDCLSSAAIGRDDEISSALLAELERRADQDERCPGGYTVEEVESRLLAPNQRA